jgi:hypothetical protein
MFMLAKSLQKKWSSLWLPAWTPMGNLRELEEFPGYLVVGFCVGENRIALVKIP